MTDESYEPGTEEEAEQAKQEKEARGGPMRRLSEFAEERFATRRPKDAPEDVPVAPTDRAMARSEESKPILTPDFRTKRMEQYRALQRQQMEEEAAPPVPSADEDEGEQPPAADDELPQPVSPPPANNWIPIGPSVLRQGQMPNRGAMAGRIAGLAVGNSGSRVYAASASGGVWRSDDGGLNWHSTMEAWDLDIEAHVSNSLACGAIAIDPADADRVYVGTGEAAYSFIDAGSVVGTGAYFGIGPIRSDDGGANWHQEASSPSLQGSAFYALAVDPGNRERVAAATINGLYLRQETSPGSGTYQWNRQRTGIHTSVVAARSGGTTTFFAAQWSGSVWRSTDGVTWTVAGSSFPTYNVGRIGLAVRPGNPDVVYALIHNLSTDLILGVWRLDGAATGGTWRQVTGHPADLFGPGYPYGQGSYDLAITIDPNNINRIYLGGSTKDAGLGAMNPDTWAGSVYRSIITSSGSGSTLSYSMTNTAIGSTVHADIHSLVPTPGNSNELWAGTDGGVFFTDTATGGATFESRNLGLSTLTMEYLAQHPTEDAVLFCGTQDNGSVRFTGEEAWLHMAPGDGGHTVVNWHDPYRVLVTYPSTRVRRFTDGGTRYNYTDVFLITSDKAMFYAPLVGTPVNPAAPAEAERVAIGTTRPWISDSFGGGWTSAGSSPGTSWGDRIKSMAFASYSKLYAGTMNGRVYRYTEGASGWSRTRIDDDGGLPWDYSLPVTDIAVDPADASGDSIYVTFGGLASDYRRVWYYDGTDWEQRSGPSDGHPNSLLDVQHNALVIDPANTDHLYVGADIGVWRSTDAGANWTPFAQGLPDAAVIDLKLHAGRRLLRASTYGRGVYERTLDAGPKAGIELYVRDTQLDQGRFATTNWLPDPTNQGELVRHWRGPDIKLDTPDAMGHYQFPLTGTINFLQFVDTLVDDFQNVATHATATITTRVYVQVHNRGVVPANGVQVMLLLANASTSLPSLPPGYEADVQAGNPINTANWQTIGFDTLDDVRVGAPKIASFNLTSDKLPPPASLAGNNHHCVLALVHHPDDPYTSTQTHTDTNSLQERKAAHKNLTVVQFTGTLPTPAMMMFRIYNSFLEEVLLTDLFIRLNNYPGRVRLYIPPMEFDGPIEELAEGCSVEEDFEDYELWLEQHLDMIERSEPPYNELWVEQRLREVRLPLEFRCMLHVREPKGVALHRIQMEPDSYHTIFVLFDRPDAQIGEAFDIEMHQYDVRKERLIGGLDARVEVVPEPRIEKAKLKLWTHDWLYGYVVIRAELYGPDGESLTPEHGAGVELAVQVEQGMTEKLGEMRWHRSWRSFYAYFRGLPPGRIVGTGLLHGKPVAKAVLGG